MNISKQDYFIFTCMLFLFINKFWSHIVGGVKFHEEFERSILFEFFEINGSSISLLTYEAPKSWKCCVINLVVYMKQLSDLTGITGITGITGSLILKRIILK